MEEVLHQLRYLNPLVSRGIFTTQQLVTGFFLSTVACSVKLGSGYQELGMMFGASSSLQQITGYSCLVGVHLDIVLGEGEMSIFNLFQNLFGF